MQIFDAKTLYNRYITYLNIKRVDSNHTLVEDYIELKNIIEHISFQSLKPKDKIFITSKSRFPSSFLSKIEGVDIKRTIKCERADKIIIDEEALVLTTNPTSFYFYQVYNKENELVLNFLSYGNYTSTAVLNNLYNNSVFTDGEKSNFISVKTKVVSLLKMDYDTCKMLLDLKDKVVSTKILNEYLANFMPDLTLDLLENIKQLLLSRDKGTVKLGVELLHTYDPSSIYFKTLVTLNECYPNIREYGAHNNAAFKHILSMLDISLNTLESHPTVFYNKIYNSLNDTDKAVVREYMKQVLMDRIIESGHDLIFNYNFNVEIN